MELIRAKKEDIARMMEIIDGAKAYFKENKIDQWQDGYPNHESLMEDIERGVGYLLVEEGKILGLLAAIYGIDENYKEIDGSWLTKEENYLVVHRISVDTNYKGRGLAVKMMEEVEEMAKKLGASSIRIDTHEENRSMKRLIEKLGYSYCGIIELKGENGAKRVAFEKLL